MDFTIAPFTVQKRVPLRISRGTTAASTNVWLQIHHDGITGWGEASPFCIGDYQRSAADLITELNTVQSALRDLHPHDRQRIAAILAEFDLSGAAQAAIDVALHDWLGKRVGLPLWQLWGLDRAQISPTSVTIGILPPAEAVTRLHQWQAITTVKSVKVKLGSPDGIEADQAMIRALLPQIAPEVKLSVDANGGWTLADAIALGDWLADHRVTYVEQPLARGHEAELPTLYARSPLPIFVDESCFTSRDIPALCDRVHGINIKLMKCGGVAEAHRMIATARAAGLQVMFGCYSDSTLANTALAHLSPLADHLDLDSHLNLQDDPFQGAVMHHGCLVPPDQPGLGVTQHASQS